MSAMVDLQNTDGGQFSEPFYILLMEKVASGAMMHMWRLVLSSEPGNDLVHIFSTRLYIKILSAMTLS